MTFVALSLKHKENNLQECLVMLWENVYLEIIQNHLKVDLETVVPNMHWKGGKNTASGAS